VDDSIQERLKRWGDEVRVSTRKWDLRFLELAKHYSAWSKDPSTQCGAVIVNFERRIVSTGYNGFAQGMDDDPALYEDREVKYSRVIHAEINALIFAERSVRGMTLYTWPFACCDRCTVVMLQAGIDRFVMPPLPADKVERWGAAMEKSKRYAMEVGAQWHEVNV
jgi:dCMP deaminase